MLVTLKCRFDAGYNPDVELQLRICRHPRSNTRNRRGDIPQSALV